MPIPEKEFCTISPIFPMTASIICIIATPLSGTPLIIPLPELVTTSNHASEIIPQYAKEMLPEQITIADETLMMNISFHTLYPLLPNFWDSPSLAYTPADRIRLFVQATNFPDFYAILVTPSKLGPDGKGPLCPALPFFRNGSLRAVKQFMHHSDHPVDQRAKESAIYYIIGQQRYNWKTKELSNLETAPAREGI